LSRYTPNQGTNPSIELNRISPLMPVFKPLLSACLFITISAALHAQNSESLQRLPLDILDVKAPSERVAGTPGNMQIIDRSCHSSPATDVRRRIVNTAVQEWAYFGYGIDRQPRTIPGSQAMPRGAFARLSPTESARLATSIAGYWAATPNSDWILQRQNANWNSDGPGARWRDAWSAAFISWVMCESGLGESHQFRRAIAHHTYIDQAIRASDDHDSSAAFTAYKPGSEKLEPGDMLCRGTRPAYRTLAERRAQLGVGARTHCDIVVKVDEQGQQIMVIGGNVRSSVRMKVLHAVQDDGEQLRPLSDNGRALFAHLKLAADAIELNALDNTPSMASLNCKAPQANLLAILPSVPAKTSC
jgi:hypothetical protein